MWHITGNYLLNGIITVIGSLIIGVPNVSQLFRDIMLIDILVAIYDNK